MRGPVWGAEFTLRPRFFASLRMTSEGLRMTGLMKPVLFPIEREILFVQINHDGLPSPAAVPLAAANTAEWKITGASDLNFNRPPFAFLKVKINPKIRHHKPMVFFLCNELECDAIAN